MTSGGFARMGGLIERETRATGLPLRGLMVFALAAHLLTAAAAVNPIHPDEHFQVLEPAFARAGHAPLDALPWEFHQQIRSAVQPVLAMAPLALLRGVGVDSPFVWVSLLRLMTLAAAAGITLLVAMHTSPGLSRSGRRMLWLSSLCLWFLPFLRFRFTGENLGGMALAASVLLLTAPAAGGDEQRAATSGAGSEDVASRAPGARGGPWWPTAAGALLGLSVVLRFQMALAALGLLAWLVFHRRTGWRTPARVVATAALVVAAAGLVDAWFYGAWVFTPWRYFQANLLEGVAASFGTSPWHWYLTRLSLWMGPPLSLGLAALLVAALVRHRGSPWVWLSVAFFAGHTLVAHKELRFLFPLAYALPVLLALGTDALGAWWSRLPWRRVVFGALAAQNVSLLLLMATPLPHRGTDVDAHYLRFLWERAEEAPEQPLYVLHDGPGPYDLRDLTLEAFRHPMVREVPVGTGAAPDPATSPGAAGLPGVALPADATAGRVLYMTTSGRPPGLPQADGGEPVYRAEPAWTSPARSMGGEGSGWLEALERLSGWAESEWARSVYELRPGGG